MDSDLAALPLDAELPAYEVQAEHVFAGHVEGRKVVLGLINRTHPRFMHAERTWQPLDVSPVTIQQSAFTLDDAKLIVARQHDYANWDALRRHVMAVHTLGTPEYRYERAVEAVINGDEVALADLLDKDPALISARSTRITCHDPAVHAATLLHYLGANGVESYRQRSPANAVAIAHLLLSAGADPNAPAHMYGGECCLLSMLVSSSPPAEAGVQVPLVHALVDGGANVEGAGATAWTSPLLTALQFGFWDAATALASHGALVDTVAKAAGLGRLEQARALFGNASDLTRHQALALAVLNGKHDVVVWLLEQGEDPNRLNPAGFHAHQTPLHGAALAGDLAMVQLLVSHGARQDIKDTIYDGTPLGWARHRGQQATSAYLQALQDGDADY